MNVVPKLAILLIVTGCNEPSNFSSANSENGEDRYVAFVGATLIDGTGSPATANSVVLIQGEKIISAGPKGEVDLPDSADVIDVSGKWIVPGLIDAHTHFMESGRIYTNPGLLNLTHLVPYEEEVAWMQARVPVTLRSYLCAGVTSSVSLGGPRFEYQVKEQANNTDKAPNVFIAHGPISPVPPEILFPMFDGDTAVRFATGPEAATDRVIEGAEWGADLIKAGYLGGPFATYEGDFIAINKAIVIEAKRHKLKVTTHVTEIEAARKLLEVGVDSLQHLPMDAVIDESFIDLAESKGAIFVPTLAVSVRSAVEIHSGSIDLLDIEKRCGDPQVIESWSAVDKLPERPPGLAEDMAAGTSNEVRNMKLLYDAGLPLAAGSDSGNLGLLHGASLHYELKLMGQAGMAPSDLIVAATLNAAKVAGQEDIVGSIEAAKRADFIILTDDPMTDISNLQAIESVVKSGKVFRQSDLLPDD